MMSEPTETIRSRDGGMTDDVLAVLRANMLRLLRSALPPRLGGGGVTS